MNYLNISYKLNCEGLASPSEESDPNVTFWSSTIRDWDKGVVQKKVEWINQEQTISTGSIKLPVNFSGGLMKWDACIGVELSVKTLNHEGKKCYCKAGSAYISLRDIAIQVKNGKKEVTKVKKLILKSLTENVFKSEIEITIKSISSLSSVEILPKTEYSIDPSNYEFLHEITSTNLKREMVPFMEAAKQEIYTFEGLYSEDTKLHDAIWSSFYDIPGIFFWVDYDRRMFATLLLSNMLDITLSRRNLSKEDFVKIVDNQYRRNDEIVNDEYHSVLRVLCDFCALVPTSFRYKSDETYKEVKQEETMKKVSLEIFLDAITYGAGDCEDLANCMYFIFNMIKYGREEYKDTRINYKKHGGWDDPLLDALQKVAFPYINGGELGIVTSRWLGENDDAKVGAPKPIIIDSQEDRNVETGGHMFCLAINTVQFVKCINNIMSKNAKPFEPFPEGYFPRWTKNLTPIVGEGTGQLDGLLKPEKEYYMNDENRKKAYREALLKVNAFTNIAKRTKRIKKSSIQLIQTQTESYKRLRLSRFYRELVSFNTDNLFREGFPIGKFVWITDVAKKQKKYGNLGYDLSISSWRVGIDLSDLIYQESYIGLFIVPPLTEDEILVAKSKLEKFLPKKILHLTNLTNKRNEIETKIQQFRKDLESIFSEEVTMKNMQKEITYFDVVFRGDEIFDPEDQREVLSDIRSFKEILDYRLYVEVIADDLYNVRLRLICEEVKNVYPPFPYEQQSVKERISSEIKERLSNKSISIEIDDWDDIEVEVTDDVNDNIQSMVNNLRERLFNQCDIIDSYFVELKPESGINAVVEQKIGLVDVMAARNVEKGLIVKWKTNEGEKVAAYIFENTQERDQFVNLLTNNTKGFEDKLLVNYINGQKKKYKANSGEVVKYVDLGKE